MARALARTRLLGASAHRAGCESHQGMLVGLDELVDEAIPVGKRKPAIRFLRRGSGLHSKQTIGDSSQRTPPICEGESQRASS